MPEAQSQPPQQYAELHSIRESLISEKPRKQTKLWIVLGVVAIVILVMGSIVQVFTPQKVKIPQTNFVMSNSNNTRPNLRTVTYTGPAVDLPNSFAIYSATSVLSEGKMIADLSAKFGLLRDNPDSNIWTNDEISLTHDETRGIYTLVLKDLTEEKLPVVDKDRAILVASAFLKDTFPEVNLRPLEDQVSFFEIGLEIEESASPEEANGINIPYTPVLESEDYPVIFEKADQPMFTVTVDGKYTIRMLLFYPDFKQYQKVDALPPISTEDALKNIQNGIASIITASIVEPDRVTMSQLTSATFSTAKIEYREDSGSGLLYPFYRFSGTATAGQVTADVDVITPAVKVTPQTR